ncbi:MAG TPA: PIN domain-containing protein [Geobacteraceae bacterium]
MARKRPASRVFLDSNVILSGLLSDRGAPRIILDLVCLELATLKGLTGAYNLIEIERNLARKFPALVPVYEQYLPRLNLDVVPLPTREEIASHLGVTADKDVPVLVSALNGRADFLVTGDNKDFGPLKKLRKFPFRIVTPAEFLAVAGEVISAGMG